MSSFSIILYATISNKAATVGRGRKWNNGRIKNVIKTKIMAAKIADTLQVQPDFIFITVRAKAAVAGIPPNNPTVKFERAAPKTSFSQLWSVLVISSALLADISVSKITINAMVSEWEITSKFIMEKSNEIYCINLNSNSPYLSFKIANGNFIPNKFPVFAIAIPENATTTAQGIQEVNFIFK